MLAALEELVPACCGERPARGRGAAGTAGPAVRDGGPCAGGGADGGSCADHGPRFALSSGPELRRPLGGPAALPAGGPGRGARPGAQLSPGSCVAGREKLPLAHPAALRAVGVLACWLSVLALASHLGAFSLCTGTVNVLLFNSFFFSI